MVDKQCDDLHLGLRIKFILPSNQVERSVAVIILGRSISAMFQQKADDFGEIGKHPKMKGIIYDSTPATEILPTRLDTVLRDTKGTPIHHKA